jgi:hypothetical protein
VRLRAVPVQRGSYFLVLLGSFEQAYLAQS